MGRMQFEVGGTWGVMEMSCLDTSEGVHHSRPEVAVVLGPSHLGALTAWQGRGFLLHLNSPKEGSCLALAEGSPLGHLPH